MNIPPAIFDLRVAEADKSAVHVWLPVFLLWPLLLVLFVVALVITVILDVLLFVAGQRYHHYTRFLIGCLGLLAGTRGVTAHIRSEKADVDLTVL